MTTREYTRYLFREPAITEESIDEEAVYAAASLVSGMRPTVGLSYLPKEQQQIVCDAIESEDCTPAYVQAMKMRKFSEEGRLTGDARAED